MKKFSLLIFLVFAILFLPAVAFAWPKAYLTDFVSKVIITDVADSTVSKIDVGSTPYGIAINPDGTKVYVANQSSGDIAVVDVLINTVVDRIVFGSGYTLSGIDFNPSGTVVYAAVNGPISNGLYGIDVATKSIVTNVGIGGSPGPVLAISDNKIYVTARVGLNYYIYVVNPNTSTVDDTILVGATPIYMVANSAKSKVYVSNQGDPGGPYSISIVDVSLGSVTSTISLSKRPLGIAINPSETKLYVADYNDFSISVFNLPGGTLAKTISTGSANPFVIEFDSLGEKYYVGIGTSLSIFDSSNDEIISRIDNGGGMAVATKFISPLPEISFSSSSLSFDKTKIGLSKSQTLTISNSQEVYLNISDVSLAGANSFDFEVQNNSCLNNPLGSEESCTLEIVFSPNSFGTKEASLQVISDDPINSIPAVNLSGKGVYGKRAVTKSAKQNEILIEDNETFYANNLNFLFTKFPKKLEKKKYYLEIQKFAKYSRKFKQAKKFSIKKYWQTKTNLNKYKAKKKKDKFKAKLIFRHTNKEFKVLKKQNKKAKEKNLKLKYYNPKTKTWRNLSAKHNKKKNTFTVVFNKFLFPATNFIIGLKN
jgi:YVTN family beta-propeller protein